MTQDALTAARTYAELTAIAATLKGAALQQQLDAVNLGFLRNRPAGAKREALVSMYGRDLDARAIEANARTPR